jgi:MFS transporter, SP family, sugar:H+ symporter
VPAVTTLLAGPFLPESPRWLVEIGKINEARASLLSINKGKPTYDVDKELTEIESSHQAALAKGNKPTWRSLFKGTNLKRTLLTVGIQCIPQSLGLGFMANYLILFFIQLGIPEPFKILVICEYCQAGLLQKGYFKNRSLV